MDIGQQFMNIIDPSTTLGAFIISLLASLFGGFLIGRAVYNQKGKYVNGDMIQGSEVHKR